MQIISSRQTSFVKWIYPGLGAALLVFASVLLTMAMVSTHTFTLLGVAPELGLVIVAIGWKTNLYRIADEVKDGGSFLVIRRGRLEDRIPFADVTNVSFSRGFLSLRVTLSLRTSCKFGDKVIFMLPEPNLFHKRSSIPVYEDLLRRVDRARQGLR